MRHSGGKKVPVVLQRMRAEDLLAAVFPEQVMCQDNRPGPVEIPDHPLVNETLRDCLHEAMDLGGLLEILTMIDSGKIRTVAIDTPVPSPMAHEILNANPYAFLDDAPLAERRARAVSLRRLDPSMAREWRALDPAAIPGGKAEPPVALPLGFKPETLPEEEALRRIVGGWLDVLGPTTVSASSKKLGLAPNKIATALIGLEASGAVLRGEFTARAIGAEIEWCERGLLARIHR